VRLRLILGAVVAIAAAVVVFVAVRSPGALERPALFLGVGGQGAVTGRPAPPFTLPELEGDQAYSLATVPGTVTVLNFWATWCRYCRQEMPLLDRLAATSGGRVRVLGIDFTSEEGSVGSVRAFVRRLGVHYPVLLDETGATFRQYGVKAYPTTYFLDGRGVVTGVVIGQLTPAILGYELREARTA
jgi:thiol-disulfide isomerase/thioredoxin